VRQRKKAGQNIGSRSGIAEQTPRAEACLEGTQGKSRRKRIIFARLERETGAKGKRQGGKGSSYSLTAVRTHRSRTEDNVRGESRQQRDRDKKSLHSRGGVFESYQKERVKGRNRRDGGRLAYCLERARGKKRRDWKFNLKET